MEFDEPPGPHMLEPPPRRLPPPPPPSLPPAPDPVPNPALGLAPEPESPPAPEMEPPAQTREVSTGSYSDEVMEVQQSERIPLWARLSVRHTKKTCLVALAVPLICLGIIIGAGLFKLSESSQYEFIVKDHPVPELDHSRVRAREEYPFQTQEPEPFSELDGVRQFNILIRNTLPNGDPAKFDPDATRINLLTREGMAFLKRVEDTVINDPNYELFCRRAPADAVDCNDKSIKCVLPESITNNENLYGIKGTNNEICRSTNSSLVPEDRFNEFLKIISNGSDIRPQAAIFMGKDLTGDSMKTQLLRSFIPIGEEPENYTKPDNQPSFEEWSDSMYKKVEDLTNSEYHAFVYSVQRISDVFGPTIQRDQMFSAAAVGLVFVVIILHTGSTFLASIAMLQIILAFPFAYFVYRGILQISYYGPLNVLTVFLILGIGADDVFVFVDAWKQAAVVLGANVSLEKRMAWSYHRAVKAMSVTTFTTAVAFFTTAVSPIMPIATLGIWSGFLILLQFLLVITVFPSALVIWQRFWRVHRWYRCWKKQEDDSAQPNPEDVSASSNSANITLTDLEETSLGAVQLQRSPTVSDLESGATAKKRRPKKSKEGELRLIERFFNGPWTRITRIARYPLLVISLGLIGVSIWLATKLSTPTEAEQFLPDDHPLLSAGKLLTDGFPSKDGDENVKVKLVWGLGLIDRTGTNKYDPDDLGNATFDNSFNLRPAKAQDRIYKACNAFKDKKRNLLTNLTTVSEKVVCWPADYLEWLNAEKKQTAFKDFDTDQELIDELIEFSNFTVNGRQPYLRYLTDQRIVFNKRRTEILYTEIEFVSRLKANLPYSVMWPERNKWEKARLDFNSFTETPGVANARVTAEPWVQAITQKALVDNMFLGIGVVFAVSFAALCLSTGNLIVSAMALFSIGGILCNVLALVQLLGWKLGVTESIGVVIAIGFSFDYVAHVANAYVESPRSANREQRTRAALTELGVSIIAGAVSTILAGSMLFFAIIIFFVKFAVFVVATVSFALLWGLVFFPAFLHIAGPTGNMGEIWTFLGKLIGRKPNEEEETQFGTLGHRTDSRPRHVVENER